MRHKAEGAADFATQIVKSVIINAGDGAHAHPSQALLDLFNETIYSINELSDEYRSFYQLCKQENENLSSAEKEQLRYSYKLIEQHSDLLTIQPVLQYFYKKVEEIGKIRYVMIAIKSGVDKEKIKDKLK